MAPSELIRPFLDGWIHTVASERVWLDMLELIWPTELIWPLSGKMSTPLIQKRKFAELIRSIFHKTQTRSYPVGWIRSFW